MRNGLLADISPALPTSIRGGIVLFGDLLALVAFVLVGIIEHGGNPMTMSLQHILELLAPFVLAWFLFAPFTGVYHRNTLSRYHPTLVLVGGTWFGAGIVGSLIRSTTWFPGDAPLNFVLVTLLFGGLFLLSWRALAIWGIRQFGAGPEEQ